MRINTITSFSISQTQPPQSQRTAVSQSFGIKPDSFVQTGIDPLKKLQHYTIEEYKSLSQAELELLRARFGAFKESLPTQRALYARSFKELFKPYKPIEYIEKCEGMEIFTDFGTQSMEKVFDNAFGKDNYIVVSIGRSLSSLTHALGYRIGENNIKQLPISDAWRYKITPDNIDNMQVIFNKIQKDDGRHIFLNYLESIGLDKASVDATDKHIVLTDYGITGASLEGATHLLQSPLIWNNRPNVHPINIIKLAKNLAPNRIRINCDQRELPHGYIANCFGDFLFKGQFKDISLVDSSKTLSSTLNASSVTHEDTVKLMWFRLLDNFMTNREIIRYNPEFRSVTQPSLSPLQKVAQWNNSLEQFNEDWNSDLYIINSLILQTPPEQTARLGNLQKLNQNLIALKRNPDNKPPKAVFEEYYNIRPTREEILNS